MTENEQHNNQLDSDPKEIGPSRVEHPVTQLTLRDSIIKAQHPASKQQTTDQSFFHAKGNALQANDYVSDFYKGEPKRQEPPAP